MAQINPDYLTHIAAELPEHLDMDEFISACQRPLRKSIRVNTLKISVADFKLIMQSKGWEFEPIPWCNEGFWVIHDEKQQPGNSVEHIQGLFYIQEASSMLPPEALFDDFNTTDIDNQSIVLDVASAPGSKTTQLAALMQNQGLLIANEYSASRVKILHANVQRMGIRQTALTHFDGKVFGEYLYEKFDAILLDAPCGGEGTVRKDVNALKNWQLDDVTDIAETQKQLIESAFLALKPGGSLVYSTCTLSQIENQQICHFIQQQYPDSVEFLPLNHLFKNAEKACTPEGFLHVWPQIFDSEGFFVAKIRKTVSVPRLKKCPKQQRNFPFVSAKAKQTEEIAEYLAKSFNIHLPQQFDVMTRDDEYWLFPAQFSQFIGLMRFQRIGFKLADVLKKGFKVKHEAIIALSDFVSNQDRVIELNRSQAVEFLMGRDIPTSDIEGLDTTPAGEMIVSFHHKPLGVVKHLGHRLKNNLPRELVKDKIETI
ncbi:16S rRNA (cytosine(1407)-C(5))-methyltransferase RsmF [Shewanella sp. KT0246]|uniref:16S rRNA (cytosine(1407)-C(5))-methyltransferase RsmF n=1 Tax=Shewanella sp. KT0246 TaxID=2815912 RepID=UPI001BBD069A|nr:16S rRNA (cytosine(1407)-C(5))-methyltransferase RsmF [Shewanella sp. KT0246]GIU53300.1 ribosomal RNA small subunit methyltransferase F [Shewanella sp. KT0246]